MTSGEKQRINLLDLDRQELHALMAAWGEPGYRADQVWQWLYVSLAAKPGEMSNLPKRLRARLAQETLTGALAPTAEQRSRDGKTIKWLFDLPPVADTPGIDAQSGTSQVETVLMRYDRRRTACISSQAGCGMACTFCATGQMGLQRNLTAGEIVGQVLFVARHLASQNEELTNVVLMGMGEPLANYAATMTALRRLTAPDGFNMGQRRMTLSTVGLVPGIGRFSRENLQVGLAVSLHAATDSLRDTLVPINRRYPLEQLFAVCREYVTRTRRRISFEWALIAGVNDSVDQAHTLAERIRGMLCHVNLIPLNPTVGFPGRASAPANVVAFRAELESHGIPTTLRVRRGIDIQAGCGQLREREASEQIPPDHAARSGSTEP
jgi:23S rRNA (adenine2503-C2)-methyltransferase